MDENRLKRMQALAKKVDKIDEELEVLIDAQLFQMSQSGCGEGIVTQLKIASDHIKKALYSFALAEAEADAGEITDQMMANLERLRNAAEES